MPSQIGTLAAQTAGTVINTGMGLLLGNYNDRRQLKQQRKLQELQIEGDKQMSDYNYAKQLQMWKDTNYNAQVEELKKAGLNPGLMYGMGGGGGTTTGSGGGNVTGGMAPSGGNEVVAMQQLGLQRGLQKAQIENIEADTNKKNVEATKLAGVDTTNVEADTKLKQMETDFKELQRNMINATFNDQVQMVENQMKKSYEELHSMEMNNELTEETFQDRIDKIKAEAVGVLIENAYKESGTEVNKALVDEIKNKIAQGWKDLDIKEKDMLIKKFAAEFQANHPGLWNVLGGAIQRIADGIANPKNERKVN